MHIQAPESWHFQDHRREDLSVGRHHNQIGMTTLQLLDKSLVTRPFGFKIGRPFSTANSLTGEGCSFRSLPFGRSGWVITSGISKSADSKSRCRLAQDSSGVPMKIMRNFAMTGGETGGRLISATGEPAPDASAAVGVQERPWGQ